MHFSNIVLSASALLCGVNAIDMKYYKQGDGVLDGFKDFFKTYFVAIEDANSGTDYTNYFAEDAHLKVLDPTVYDIVGPTNIGKFRALAIANLTWNHFPNTTTVLKDETGSQLISIDGKIETTWATFDNECSTSYITWWWNMTKVNGEVDLTAQNKQVKVFWDYVVYPYSPDNPTGIACTG